MKTQKRIKLRTLSFVLSCLLFTGSLFAQPGRDRGRPPMPDSTQIVKMVNELATELSLNKEVKPKINDLFFDHFAEVGDLMKSSKGDRRNHRTKMDALKQKFEKQVKTLLNDEQKTKFDEFMKKQGPRSGKQRPRR
ncbi:MAG: hypothetical protein DWQ10_14335 [Calditrichaeota bacterium]|nr:MAG: hypothetical protein DWQ10_14335 [Calditrichota bacterium]